VENGPANSKIGGAEGRENTRDGKELLRGKKGGGSREGRKVNREDAYRIAYVLEYVRLF